MSTPQTGAAARRRKTRGASAVVNCATENSYYFDHNGESAYIRPMTTQQASEQARTYPLRDYTLSGYAEDMAAQGEAAVAAR